MGAVALAAAFPKVGVHGLAWIALVPLLLAVEGVDSRTAWWRGVAFGAVYRAATLYWVVGAMTRFGGLSLPVALLAAAALVAYLAAYVGLFAALVTRFAAPSPWWPLAVGCCWVGLEYAQSSLFTGFPWNLLGYAAAELPTLAQAASIGGVYLLSFLIVVVNAAVAVVFRDRARPAVVMAIVVAGLPVCLFGAYGAIELLWAGDTDQQRLTTSLAAGGSSATLDVGLVQGNVPQELKWDAGARQELVDRHLQMSQRAAAAGADLVVWPESSWPDPYGLDRDPVTLARLGDIAATYDTALVVGTIYVHTRLEPAQQAGDQEEVSGVANAALVIEADDSAPEDTVAVVAGAGRIGDRYEKERLVPFGEYLPLRRWLPDLGPLVQAVGEMRPGAPAQPALRIAAAGGIGIGMAICYEIVFPALVRQRVRTGGEVLATITNDAWYGTSSGPYQHFAMARLRAIETRRYLVRAANIGISAVIDPWGRIVSRSELGEQTIVSGTIAPRSDRTLYVRFGDVAAILCSLWVAWLLLSPWLAALTTRSFRPRAR